MTEDPFPPREVAVGGICTEIIVELMLMYEEEGLELKTGEPFVLPVPYDPNHTL
jgi:hypothetical protein